MKNLKIKFKLFLLAGFMLLGMVAVGVVSMVYMNKINDGTTIITANWMPSVIVSEELQTLISKYRIQQYKHVVAQDAEIKQLAEDEMDSLTKQINDMFQTYTGLVTSDTDRKLMQDAQNVWSSYMELHDNIIELSRENKTDQARKAVMDSVALFNEASDTFSEIVKFNKDGADQASLDGDRMYASAGRIIISSLLFIIVAAMLFALYIIRSINVPVSELDDVARRIANGDLNQSITYHSKDELGKLAVNFNKTVDRLRDYVKYIDEISDVLKQIAGGNLVFELTYDYAGEFAKIKAALEEISNSLNQTMGQINQTSDQVSAGSEQVSSGAQALSQGATEQASSIEELAATIAETAGNASDARLQCGHTGEQVATSNEQMKEMIAAMQEISDKSGEISKIIKTIEDIAFQTNILALNAAVEAARAGEAGKGFAVVADEVRNLASKSSEASKSTAALIEGTVEAVEKGTGIANATAQSLNAVVESTKSVVDTVDKIASAAEQQASSIAQVTQGIDQISSVVQTNSATAEESAAASEELSGQAQVLKNLVGQFKLRS